MSDEYAKLGVNMHCPDEVRGLCPTEHVYAGIMMVYATPTLPIAGVFSSMFFGIWNLFTGFLIGHQVCCRLMHGSAVQSCMSRVRGSTAWKTEART